MEIIAAARDLMGDPRDRGSVSPEYRRALVELTCLVLGVGEDDGRAQVETLIGGQPVSAGETSRAGALRWLAARVGTELGTRQYRPDDTDTDDDMDA